MTVRRERRRLAGAKKRLCLVLACAVMAAWPGCGQEQETAEWKPEDVELLEPVGVSLSYETAARRNLYDVQTNYAQVCAYTEQYELDRRIVFDRYEALPGEPVKKGGALLHADYESWDEQIESLEKTIADMDAAYQEFLENDKKSREKPLENQRVFGGAVETLNREKPEEYVTDEETGEKIKNPAYDEWYNKPYGYRDCENRYRQANQTLMELDEALKERTELYELDRAYTLLRLERVKEDREMGTMYSGMDGIVTGLSCGDGYNASYYGEDILYPGSTAPSGTPLVAVSDPSRIMIRSQYVAKSTYENAKDVYAIVGGKRWEVDYTPIETAEEYDRLKADLGTVYGTFYPQGDTSELKPGDYAVIVVVNDVRENVLTIPRDALVQEGRSYYTYVIKGDSYVYTKVEVGMMDARYAEILSGLEEGDRVRTQQAVTAGTGTVKVTRGKLCTEFSSTGKLLYPYTEWVCNPIKYGTCYVVENCVREQQAVKKGDVLMKIRVVPDQVEISRKEMRLQRERERLQDLIDEGDEERNKDAIKAKQETIRDLEELLSDMKSDAATTEILAPKDGIVRSRPYGYTKENSILPPGLEMYQISEQKAMYLVVENKDDQLFYGSTVTVKYSDQDKVSHTAEGQVVTGGKMSLWGEAMYAERVMVKLPQEDFAAMAGASDRDDYWLVPDTTFKVTAETRVVEDALLVPKKAVTTVGKNCYVKVKLETGEIQYRSFLPGGADANNYWVLEGLTEGMELCLD